MGSEMCIRDSGGTVWVLILNLLLYAFFTNKDKKYVTFTVLILIVPIIFSFAIKPNLDLSDTDIEVVIVQPNVDPYFDKFSRNPQQQLDDFIKLSKTKITENTNLLLGPETVLQEMIWENKIDNAQSIIKLKKLLYEFPKLNILLGSTTFKYLGNKKETNSRKLKDNTWYNVYNLSLIHI